MAIDSHLTSFIREHVRSVWALELLLLMRGDPERRWTEAELVSELRASTTLVAGILSQFQASGLVAPDGDGFRYLPASPVLEALCIRLEAAYRKRPVTVINLIAKPAHPLQSLADAFKFKGGDS